MKSITKNRVVRALSPTWRSARVLIAVAMAGVLSAACDVHGITAPGALVRISVSPNATLVTGSTQQMVAVGYDADGRVMNISPTWSVAASGGTIASSGVFTAGNVPGLFANTVVASVGTISGSASITVIPGPLATITVVPTPVTLAVTATQQFTAVGKDASGNIIAFSPTWAVIATGGTITQGGLFTAGGTTGTFTNTVQASYNNIKGFATVNVTAGPLATVTVTPNPATLVTGASQQFTAVGKDASGNVVTMTPVWTVVASGGTINAAGLFVAGSTLGTYANTVKATSGTASGTATVIVTVGPLATITITPNPAIGVIGGTVQLTAVGNDAAGNVLPITPVWDVVTLTNGASVTQTGLYTFGTVVGTFPDKVRATSGGISGFATTIATTGVLTSITVTPNPVFLQTAGVQQFTAVGHDAFNNVFVITPTWSVVNGGGGINASSGLFTAGLTVGAFANTVVATSGTVSGSATVNVAATLATIVVTPNPVSVVVSGTQQFSAVGRDANNNVFAISPVWSVASSVGSTISAAGVFTAGLVPTLFPDTVIATYGLKSGKATVNVTALPPVLAKITITPNPASMQVNATQQFAAVGYDGSNNIISFTPVWSVVGVKPDSGTINAATGFYTAGATAGTFTKIIRASNALGTIADTATVTVTALPPVLATITITPDSASVVTAGTQQFAAVGRDGAGNIISFTPVWSVVGVKPDSGTINAVTGFYTAGATAGTFTKIIRASNALGTIADTATVTVTAAPPPPPVSPLKSAAPFGVLAGTGITCAISGAINGSASNIGSFPTLTISGFPPCTFTGSIPLPGVVAVAKTDLNTAFVIMQTQVCNTDLTGKDLGFYDGSTPAKSLPAGTYCFSSSAPLTGTLKLTGSATDKWTFQIGSTLISEVNSKVLLAGGAIPDNVYWVVGTSATFKTSSAMQGNVLARTSISLQNGATLQGRALALDGAVDMTPGAVTITRP